MHFLYTILIGLIVGLVARMVKPGDDSMGWILTILLGIAGAFLATFIGQGLGWYAPQEAAGFIASVIGAVVLLLVVGMIRRR